MSFKLIRTDTEEPCKIPLPSGRHVFGRDAPLLAIHDERVAGQHGELIVTGNSVVLKALEDNVCFLKKRHTEDLYELKKDEKQDIINGDSFGVLKDMYWYELFYIGADDEDAEEMETEAEPDKLEDENEISTPPEDKDTAGGSKEYIPISPSKRSHDSDNDCTLPIKKPRQGLSDE